MHIFKKIYAIYFADFYIIIEYKLWTNLLFENNGEQWFWH